MKHTGLFERTAILVNDDGIEQLKKAHVLLAGVGGVGSFAAEALARNGIGEITLIDHDVVSKSNLNRQLVALNSNVGMKKAQIMRERILDINPDCKVNIVIPIYFHTHKLTRPEKRIPHKSFSFS